MPARACRCTSRASPSGISIWSSIERVGFRAPGTYYVIAIGRWDPSRDRCFSVLRRGRRRMAFHRKRNQPTPTFFTHGAPLAFAEVRAPLAPKTILRFVALLLLDAEEFSLSGKIDSGHGRIRFVVRGGIPATSATLRQSLGRLQRNHGVVVEVS
jgi:hypothetical protein